MSNVINFEWFKTKKVVDSLTDEQLAYDKKIMDNVYKNEIKTFLPSKSRKYTIPGIFMCFDSFLTILRNNLRILMI